MKKATRKSRRAPNFAALSREECDQLLERNRSDESRSLSTTVSTSSRCITCTQVVGCTAARAPVPRSPPYFIIPGWRSRSTRCAGSSTGRASSCTASVHIPEVDGSPADLAAYEATLALVRELVPEALSPDDPTPARQVLFRIHVDEVTGRASST